MSKSRILVGVVLAGLACHAMAATLSWQAPTTRADGSSLAASELGSYVVYKNGVAMATPLPTATSLDLAVYNLVPSDVLTIVARDVNGLISAVSVGVSIPKPVAPPSAPVLSIK